MKAIYHTEFTRKGFGQWNISIEFYDGQVLNIYSTDSELFDEWNSLEGEEKNQLIAERLDYKIEELLN